MRILVTGGAGYIGSTAVEMLLRDGYEISILDDLSTGHSDNVPSNVQFVHGSLLNPSDIAHALSDCDAVMHFAGKSLVGESVTNPALYWSVNVTGTRNLLDQMRMVNISKIVFSSSAATYGDPGLALIPETSTTNPTNPYGATKLVIDEMISDEVTKSGLAAISLRYFNVAGAVKSEGGWLTERHNPETHLIPNVLRSTLDHPIKIFGTDWPTKDGTCVRDYVHVVDLIGAHIKALGSLVSGKHKIYNLGSGEGYTVREIIQAASVALGYEVPFEYSGRRVGDPAILVADISKAKTELEWQPILGITSIMTDTLCSLG